eukprot:465175_1
MSAPSACSHATSFVDTTVGREYFYEAKRLASQKKYLKAKQLFKLVIQLRPDAASPHYHLGNVLIELNSIEEAVSHFKKAHKKKPNIIKYKQYYRHYSILYQCKYNKSHLVTPGGPIQIKHENTETPQNEENNENENENVSNDEYLTDSNDEKEADEYYLSNRSYINKFSVHKLLNEFCPYSFYVKANATTNEVLRILGKAVKFFDPKNNIEQTEYRKKLYYEWREQNNDPLKPKLNKKHLYHLLKYHKKVIMDKIKKKNKKKHWKYAKNQSFCPY